MNCWLSWAMQTLLVTAQLSPILFLLLQQVKIIKMVKYETFLISYLNQQQLIYESNGI